MLFNGIDNHLIFGHVDFNKSFNDNIKTTYVLIFYLRRF